MLSRLYGHIGAEEAMHVEELNYAKSKITGEKYVPSDPEVKKDYEELLAQGMDEDDAMNTALDRYGIYKANLNQNSMTMILITLKKLKRLRQWSML